MANNADPNQQSAVERDPVGRSAAATRAQVTGVRMAALRAAASAWNHIPEHAEHTGGQQNARHPSPTYRNQWGPCGGITTTRAGFRADGTAHWRCLSCAAAFQREAYDTEEEVAQEEVLIYFLM